MIGLPVFRHLSIRTKLILVMLVVSLPAVLGVSTAFVMLEIQQTRQGLGEEMNALAKLLGDRSSAALVFNDQNLARDNLSSLRSLTHIVLACLYDQHNRLFAEFRRDVVTPACVMAPSPVIAPVVTGLQGMAAPIYLDSQMVGSITLSSSTQQLEDQIQRQVIAGFFTLLIAVVFTVFLGIGLQRLIAGPIEQLTVVATRIESNGDTDLRAPDAGSDEIGQLARAFNAMLETLQFRHYQLASSETRFRNLVEQSPFSTQVLAPDGRTLQVNPAWEKLWGVTFDALSDYNLLEDRQLIEKGVMPYIQSAFAGAAVEIPPVVYNPQETTSVTGAPFRDRWVRAFVYPIKDAADQVREVILVHEDVTQRRRSEEAIKNIAAGVSAHSGERFFRDLVTQLARLFNADYAFIGVLDEQNPQDVTTQAVFAHGKIAANMTYSLNNTPCANVIASGTCAYPRGVQQLFPDDHLLLDMGAEAYIGTPLFNVRGEAIGLIEVLDSKPLEHIESVREILEIFAARTSAELQRLKAEHELQTSQARLTALLDIAPGAIISIDAARRIIVFNREAQRMFGYRQEEMLGQPVEQLIPQRYHTAHAVAIVEFGAETADDVRRSMGRTWTMGRHKNGDEFAVEASISKLILDGELIYTVALQDITERKRAEAELLRHREHLEELVSERTQQLASANKELESFSYSVSHDLRAPLRTIDGFASALVEDYAAGLDDTAFDYLQRIRHGTQRMGTLIDDLLNLSRVIRNDLQRVVVDLSAMAHEIIAQLRSTAPGREVTVAVAAGLQAYGDTRLLHVVLSNLLENAWKYTGKCEHAHIEVGEQQIGDQVAFYVRDNGTGFDMQYAGKLFGAFQRLHRAEEFPGTGIGLATVARIVQRHGGRVWAEAKLGQGAVFYFTLGTQSAAAESS